MIKHIKKFLLFFALTTPMLHATNYPISAGASTATIQSTINTAAAASGGNTVTFAAGNYSITSQISIPCPASPLTIQGPVQDTTVWPISPTAVLTATLTNNWAFSGTACSTGTTIQYIQYNGGDPSGGGGGMLFVPQGMNNLTVQYNWIYGNSAIQQASNAADSLIWLDGPQGTSPRTQNTTIKFNRFGSSNDCASLMNVMGGNNACTVTVNGGGYTLGGSGQCWYQDGDTEKNTGGYCAAVGIHVNTDNFTFSNNTVSHQEQGIKFYEGGQTAPNIYTSTNITVNANDWVGIHRIVLEAQQGSPGPWNITNNSEHDMILFGGVSWGLSVPQGGPQNVSNNLLIENTPKGTDRYGNPASRSYGVEYWGNGDTAYNNLIQGLWGGGIAWGYGGSGWSITNNNFQQLPTYFEAFISNEEGASNAPTQSGNVTSNSVTAQTSVAPTISPAAGAQTFPLTVTLTDAGYTSGTLPQGNTGIWYTTDGSTPVPGQGTAKYLSSGATFSLASAATVKAVGMWGALNQPTSYPAGYGFVPSAVVSAAYTGGGTPTVATPTFNPPAQSFTSSITVGASSATSGATLYCTTDGTTPTTGSPVYSASFSLTATTTIKCLGVLSGYNNSAIGSSTYTFSSSLILGQATSNIALNTYSNTYNSLYAVTGTNPTGYTVASAQVCLGTGTVTNGKSTDVGLNLATSATTEAASPICHGTYTNTSTTGPGCVTVALSGCGTLPLSTAYFLWTITNDPLSPSSFAGNNCGSSCNSTVPSTNVGTYGGFYVGGTYGTYTGMPTSFTGGPGTAQPSIMLNLVAGAPTITSGYLDTTPTSGTNSILVAGTLQFVPHANMSSGPSPSTLSASACSWASDTPSVLTIGSSTGLATGVSNGTANVTATCSGVAFAPWTVHVTSSAATLVSMVVSPYVVFVNGTTPIAPLVAVGTYSDATVKPITGPTWVSSNASVITVDASGNLTATGIGESIVTATAGTLSAQSVVVVPPNVLLGNPVAANLFPYSNANFGCFVFQKLNVGTYSLVVNTDGSFTVH